MIRITYAFLSFTILSFLVSCTAEVPAKNTDDAKDSKGAQVVSIENRVVDASCGQCQLGLPGTGCDLAVAFDGKAYYVDGSHIDDHGDAHGPAGLCNAILTARVSGQLVDGRFEAERFEVVEKNDEP